MTTRLIGKLFICFILISYCTKLNAQIKLDDSKAKIVLINGEQLSGFIKNETLSKMGVEVKFKSSEKGDFKTFKISELKKLEFETGETYEVLQASLLTDATKVDVLAKLILKGTVSVYEVNYKKDDVYIVLKNGTTYWLQDDELKSNEQTITKHFFKQTLFTIIADGGISDNEVNRISFDEKSILALITKYNSRKNSKSEIISYKPPKQAFVIAGLNGNFLNKNDVEGMANIFYRLYNPRISKSTSLNIGLQYSYRQKVQYENNYPNPETYKPTYSAISLPVVIQQNVLNKKVRPFLRGGMALTYIHIKDELYISEEDKGFQKSYGFSFLYGLGLEADLSKKIMFRGDFYRDVLDHLITVGFAYKWALK